MSPSTGFKNSRFQYASATHTQYNYLDVVGNLNVGQPVMLGGFRDRTNRFLGLYYTFDGGHAWVCDDYQQTNYVGYSFLMFHMNWGWHERFTISGNGSGGDYNGWYQYNNWNIPGLNRNYQYANDEIVNIHP